MVERAFAKATGPQASPVILPSLSFAFGRFFRMRSDCEGSLCGGRGGEESLEQVRKGVTNGTFSSTGPFIF